MANRRERSRKTGWQAPWQRQCLDCLHALRRCGVHSRVPCRGDNERCRDGVRVGGRWPVHRLSCLRDGLPVWGSPFWEQREDAEMRRMLCQDAVRAGAGVRQELPDPRARLRTGQCFDGRESGQRSPKARVVSGPGAARSRRGFSDAVENGGASPARFPLRWKSHSLAMPYFSTVCASFFS